MPTPADPDRCPLCGEANGCRMAAGDPDASHCWCSATPIPRAVLQQVRPERSGRGCVCERCATAVPAPELPTLLSLFRGRLARLRRDH